jgi:hypothetical protein
MLKGLEQWGMLMIFEIPWSSLAYRHQIARSRMRQKANYLIVTPVFNIRNDGDTIMQTVD